MGVNVLECVGDVGGSVCVCVFVCVGVSVIVWECVGVIAWVNVGVCGCGSLD